MVDTFIVSNTYPHLIQSSRLQATHFDKVCGRCCVKRDPLSLV